MRTNGAAEAASPLAVVLKLRIERVQADLDCAIDGRRWSQLPGLAGILEGVTASLAVVMASVPPGRVIGDKRAQRLAAELARRVRAHTASRDEAVLARRFAEVPGADGRATGYLMGLKAVCEELGVTMPRDIR